VHDQTNLYAGQVIGAASRPFTKCLVQTWVPVTVCKLKEFLGLMFVTGIMNYVNLKSYCTQDTVFEPQIFSKTMSRRHFKTILTFFHFNNSSRETVQDKDHTRQTG
jgi:hypothetical protein